MPAPLSLAFLGLGTMGGPMAANLARAGIPLAVWNRTPGRDDRAVAMGARRASSAADAARDAGVVITMLTGPDEVAAVLFGEAGGASGDVAGKLFVDMSTSGPRAAEQLAGRLEARGARFVDAPVSGSRAPAESGQLLVLAGGAAEDLARLEPVFGAIGRRTLHAGPVGAGQALKIVLNGLGCQQLVAFAAMLRLGERSGLSRDVLVEAFTSGAFSTPAFIDKRGRVLARRYGDPDFVLELVLRDAELCAELQREAGAIFPSHLTAHAEVQRAVDAGFGADDLFGIERLYDEGDSG